MQPNNFDQRYVLNIQGHCDHMSFIKGLTLDALESINYPSVPVMHIQLE